MRTPKTELAQILEFAGKDIKTVITVFHCPRARGKMLSRDLEDKKPNYF